MNLLNNPTRFLFFTGKGGVGKTSLSCAVAIALADEGKNVMLVCTDPASNLDEVLGCRIGASPVTIPSVDLLKAININPEEAAQSYRDKVIEPYRGKLPESALASMEEQLSGACTMEIAAFDEFAGLLGDEQSLNRYDFVVFDTAPTGHTLRLLQLPSAWDGFIDTNTTGTSCLGPLAGLTKQHQLYKNSIETLTNCEKTTVILVVRPDKESLKEAARTSLELEALGMSQQQLVINGLFTTQSDDQIALRWQEKGLRALADLPEKLATLPTTEVPLLPFSPLGSEKLRMLWQTILGNSIPTTLERANELAALPLPITALFEDIANSKNGVIMTMGKGGVGKTSIATALAVYLAQNGSEVLLATTDPAAHLDFSLMTQMENLVVERIDPTEETRRYSAKVMEQAGATLDKQGKKLLEEDLRSPCTEEVAVFQAFAALVDQGKDKFIVLDTAPTGHTLLLLDAARAYHREVERTTQELPEAVQSLLPRMRDPDHTRVLVLTLPELTPITEALLLEKDLLRAGITPYGWIINQCLTPLKISDPLLLAKQQEETPHIERLMRTHNNRVFISPWQVS
jgi:arsenite-transporting ATPase